MPAEEEKAPAFGSWRAAYALVIGVLALMVALFTAISWVYR